MPSVPSIPSVGVPSLPKPSIGGVSLGGVNMAAGAAGLGAVAGLSMTGDDGEDGEGGDKAVKDGESVTKFRRQSTQKPPDAMWTADMGKPQMKTGWAWKQGHMYKSWKKRYFVLYEGTLKYYAKYDEATGKAKNEKDSLFLKNYVFGVLPDMGNKIYIKPDKEAAAGVSKDKDLLVDFYEEDGCEPEVLLNTFCVLCSLPFPNRLSNNITLTLFLTPKSSTHQPPHIGGVPHLDQGALSAHPVRRLQGRRQLDEAWVFVNCIRRLVK